jgi:protein-S-isoprenylcysteine O-methyltransferase Ste14
MIVVPTLAMLLVGVAHVVLLQIKARNEERHLAAVHGDAYRQYLARTARFLPWRSIARE